LHRLRSEHERGNGRACGKVGPLDNRTDKAQGYSIIGHNKQQYRRRWQRDQSRSRLQPEEREMWTTLFSLALATAVCCGGAAVVVARSKYVAKYLARFTG
jgi:hypothetical protein